jgi:hypothetical protein
MNSFDNIQCDEMSFEPKQSDWLEFQMWLDSLPIRDDEIGVEYGPIEFPADDLPF